MRGGGGGGGGGGGDVHQPHSWEEWNLQTDSVEHVAHYNTMYYW